MTPKINCFRCGISKEVAGGMLQFCEDSYICSECVNEFHAAVHAPLETATIKADTIGQESSTAQTTATGEIYGGSLRVEDVKFADEDTAEPSGVLHSSLKTPKEIVKFIDDYVIGQDDAKKTLSIAIYNHYKRLNNKTDVEISKSNILMLGPTGTGKTLLAQSIARLLDVPFAIADATSLTAAGYIGEDIESCVSRLVQSAGGDVAKAEKGIIFIDEIDKIAKASAGASISRDVSGEGVQQGLLKIIEGSKVNVSTDGGRKASNKGMSVVDTTNILFICAGAFVHMLEKLEKGDSNKGIGFMSTVGQSASKIKKEVTPELLIEFGMIPEFIGRLPVITKLEHLDQNALERILVEPKNAIVRQMTALFKMEDAELVFEDGAISAIAKQAENLKTGARGARTILEKILKQAQFDVPGSEGAVVTVSADLEVSVDYQEEKVACNA